MPARTQMILLFVLIMAEATACSKIDICAKYFFIDPTHRNLSIYAVRIKVMTGSIILLRVQFFKEILHYGRENVIKKPIIEAVCLRGRTQL